MTAAHGPRRRRLLAARVMISMGIMLRRPRPARSRAMTNAMKAEQTARSITTLNGHLRSSMDLVVRDFLQIGQGLQSAASSASRTAPGATPIAPARPGGGRRPARA